ncbi:hypothetical protein M422DRAFT_265305 [Sphaerobolus stellatus SS14]|uniref:Unplaced genomic scaffold SPHSTscaffold_146, whole genome shotgun sequence n=1 Tax=Sphaerobolus stellatus (strain SS14) TaxID=990650 RepID=A0A0C9UU82_SPHS4|nr:hypothetical protein M422DRAFT_265305 [Sphaerobolus stellatus SS14]
MPMPRKGRYKMTSSKSFADGDIKCTLHYNGAMVAKQVSPKQPKSDRFRKMKIEVSAKSRQGYHFSFQTIKRPVSARVTYSQQGVSSRSHVKEYRYLDKEIQQYRTSSASVGRSRRTDRLAEVTISFYELVKDEGGDGAGVVAGRFFLFLFFFFWGGGGEERGGGWGDIMEVDRDGDQGGEGGDDSEEERPRTRKKRLVQVVSEDEDLRANKRRRRKEPSVDVKSEEDNDEEDVHIPKKSKRVRTNKALAQKRVESEHDSDSDKESESFPHKSRARKASGDDRNGGKIEVLKKSKQARTNNVVRTRRIIRSPTPRSSVLPRTARLLTTHVPESPQNSAPYPPTPRDTPKKASIKSEEGAKVIIQGPGKDGNDPIDLIGQSDDDDDYYRVKVVKQDKGTQIVTTPPSQVNRAGTRQPRTPPASDEPEDSQALEQERRRVQNWLRGRVQPTRTEVQIPNHFTPPIEEGFREINSKKGELEVELARRKILVRACEVELHVMVREEEVRYQELLKRALENVCPKR